MSIQRKITQGIPGHPKDAGACQITARRKREILAHF
jgi:hypothetical protein